MPLFVWQASSCLAQDRAFQMIKFSQSKRRMVTKTIVS